MSITRINNNVAAITATRHLNSAGSRLSKNIERLSSGLRINRAGDDAAGLTIRERLRTQIRGTNMAMRNAQDGISMVNTTEAALDSLVSSLQRIRELAIQAGNTGTNDAPAIQAIQEEVFQQIDEVNRIANTARYSSRTLFTGDNANTTDVKRGQDYVGVQISADPNASNLRSGTSILHIIQTQKGEENLLPFKKEDGQAIYATGIKDATDIAVTATRFMNGAAAAGAASNLSGLLFDGVTIEATDLISYRGVLSDGVTPFAGAISVNDSAGANSMSDLAAQVQSAIDKAETALWGGNETAIPESFVQTHVSIPSSTASIASGSGRIRFLSAKVAGSSTTANTNITDAPSKFDITFSLIDSSADLKRSAVSTRDYVEGQRVGGQYGNLVQGITGSTFDTGNFSIEVTDVIPPNRRKMESELIFRTNDGAGGILVRSFSLARGAVLNGTFVNDVFTTGDTGIKFEANDTLMFQGTNANGTTFETVFTISTNGATDNTMGDGQFATLSGLVKELNYRNLSGGVNTPRQSSFVDAKLTMTGAGKFQLFDDIAEISQSSFFMVVDDYNTTRTLTDRSQILINGNAETATLSVNGGPRQQVHIDDEVMLYGPEKTAFGEQTERLTLRVGAGFRSEMSESIFAKGTDVAEIIAQEYSATLNGGQAVTFQNGDKNVFFESGVSQGVAETLLLDFDTFVDITGPSIDGGPNTGMAILLSTVNQALNFQVGPFKGQDLQVNIPDMRGDNIGYGRGSGMTVSDINVTTVSGVNLALDIVDRALDQVSRTRSALGAFTNRLDTTIESLSVSTENLQASESRLSDVDLASETSAFTSNQILFQAGTSVLAQANFMPQGLLSLLG